MIAIYNVFDGEELLEKSVGQLNCGVVCVVQTISNWGEHYEGGLNEVKRLGLPYVIYKPDLNLPAFLNEMTKRNRGIDYAISKGHSHYIHMDCDEMYFKDEFEYYAKEAIKYKATVCKMQTYFKSPELTIGLDNYYVPFICEIGRMSQRNKCGYYCDRTRTPANRAIELPITMHHYSYVRKDIRRKIENSSARENIKKSTFETDWANAKEGYPVGMFQGKTLKKVDDYFAILQL